MDDIPTLSESKHLIHDANFQFQVAKLGQLGLRMDDLSDFMDIVVTTVAKTLNAEYCKILKYLPKEENLLLISGVGWKDGIVGKTTVNVKEKSQAGYTMIMEEPVIVHDLTKENRFTGPDLLLDHNVISGISVIIKGREGIFGVLGVHSTEKQNYRQDHANFLLSVSYILAATIEQRNNIEQLKKRERDSNELIETASDAIFICNDKFDYIQVNTKATELTGYSKEELLNMNIVDLLTEDQIQEKPIRLRSFEVGGTYVTERKLKKKSGDLIPVEINSKRLADDKYLGMVRDLTQRKLNEEKLIRESKFNTFTHLSGGIAHDFNNLLNVIIGNISIAERLDIQNKELNEILSNISLAADRATNITRQLLLFSRNYIPEIEVVDVKKLLDEVVSFTFHGSKIKPIVSVKYDEPILIKADSGQISQVLQNILINAEEAMQNEVGTIEIIIETLQTHEELLFYNFDNPALHISVKDKGIGINEDDMENIFDPFFTTKSTGKGLGLSSSYAIIKNHHGMIDISSEEGGGTTVDLFLPLYLGVELPKTSQVKDENLNKLSGKIIVLEDDKLVQSTLEKMLQSLGLEVFMTSDGNETISLYKNKIEKNEKVDFILLDLTIQGGLGGFQTLQKLRDFDPKVKAIVSSGYSKDYHQDNYKDFGIDAMLSKPYTIKELYEILIKIKE